MQIRQIAKLLVAALATLTLADPSHAAKSTCWTRYNSCSKKCVKMGGQVECYGTCAEIYQDCTGQSSGSNSTAARQVGSGGTVRGGLGQTNTPATQRSLTSTPTGPSVLNNPSLLGGSGTAGGGGTSKVRHGAPSGQTAH